MEQAEVIIANYTAAPNTWVPVSAPFDADIISIEFINNTDNVGLLISKSSGDLANAANYLNKAGSTTQVRAQFNTYGTAPLKDDFYISADGGTCNATVVMVIKRKV